MGEGSIYVEFSKDQYSKGGETIERKCPPRVVRTLKREGLL
jgi:hypothetical protein